MLWTASGAARATPSLSQLLDQAILRVAVKKDVSRPEHLAAELAE
jgi:hypothetical protein